MSLENIIWHTVLYKDNRRMKLKYAISMTRIGCSLRQRTKLLLKWLSKNIIRGMGLRPCECFGFHSNTCQKEQHHLMAVDLGLDSTQLSCQERNLQCH